MTIHEKDKAEPKKLCLILFTNLDATANHTLRKLYVKSLGILLIANMGWSCTMWSTMTFSLRSQMLYFPCFSYSVVEMWSYLQKSSKLCKPGSASYCIWFKGTLCLWLEWPVLCDILQCPNGSRWHYDLLDLNGFCLQISSFFLSLQTSMFFMGVNLQLYWED